LDLLKRLDRDAGTELMGQEDSIAYVGCGRLARAGIADEAISLSRNDVPNLSGTATAVPERWRSGRCGVDCGNALPGTTPSGLEFEISIPDGFRGKERCRMSIEGYAAKCAGSRPNRRGCSQALPQGGPDRDVAVTTVDGRSRTNRVVCDCGGRRQGRSSVRRSPIARTDEGRRRSGADYVILRSCRRGRVLVVGEGSVGRSDCRRELNDVRPQKCTCSVGLMTGPPRAYETATLLVVGSLLGEWRAATPGAGRGMDDRGEWGARGGNHRL